ncbi:hypothetical protein [Catenulispora subtropica]|uniref:Uncharacterized protein n=1 Tax=Catenulispora subtropica TaxID=450798 RepID=A0ABP5E631_9ACTN
MTDLSASGPLDQGAHSMDADGLTLRYRVHGTGPAVVAHPGGPGILDQSSDVPSEGRRPHGAAAVPGAAGTAAARVDLPRVDPRRAPWVSTAC